MLSFIFDNHTVVREMNDDEVSLYKLILEIHGTSLDLKRVSDSMNGGANITAAERAALESLLGRDARTVPQIAKAKQVSRQHIQLLVDGLASKGLVRHSVNPEHKRSKLISLTETGRRILKDIRDKETKTLSELATRLGSDDAQKATRALRDLRRELLRAQR